MNKHFGDIAGYTQNELEAFFAEWLNATAVHMNISEGDTLTLNYPNEEVRKFLVRM